MTTFVRKLSLVGALVTVALFMTACDSNPTHPSPGSASVAPPIGDTSGQLTQLSAHELTHEEEGGLTLTIDKAKTKCGIEGDDYIRIGGKIEGLDPSTTVTVEIWSEPPLTFRLEPVEIPAGTRGPVDIPISSMQEGMVKLKLPEGGAGEFHLNVDGSGLNICKEGVPEATLYLSFDGRAHVASILMTRKTDSKFRSF